MCEAALSVAMRMLRPKKKEAEKDAREEVASLSLSHTHPHLFHSSFPLAVHYMTHTQLQFTMCSM